MDVSDKGFYITAAVTGVLCAILAVVYIKVRGHDQKWTIMSFGAAVVFGLATVAQLAVAIAPLPLANRGGQGNPQTPHGTIDSPSGPLQPSASSPAVLYTGNRDLAATYAADLDNPTWAVAPVSSQPAGADIYFDAGGNLSRYSGEWGVLRSQGGNGYQECAGFTAFAASLVPVSGLGAGTRLCVRTSEGRIGLLIVRGVSGRDFTAIMSFDVTIWD